MTSRSFVALLALFAIVFLPLTAVAETPEGEAVKAAEAWLALVDSGDYSKSWDAAAAYFRGAVTKEKWEEIPFRLSKRCMMRLAFITNKHRTDGKDCRTSKTQRETN